METVVQVSAAPAPHHITLGKELTDTGGGFMVETATIAHVANGRSLRLRQQLGEECLAPLFDGSVWAGTRVWEAALALIDQVIESHREELAAGARVVELGCGLGLPGMVCAALGARVVLTEVPEVLGLLEQNVALNFNNDSGCSDGSGSAHVAALRWDVQTARTLAALEGTDFDFILCCDCVCQGLYGESWHDLADCIEVLCGPRTRSIISLQRRGPDDGVDLFLAYLGLSLTTELVSSQEVDGKVILVYTARRQAQGLGT